MFRPITLKQLNSLTTIKIPSCLGGLEVMHQTVVPEVQGLIPGSVKDFNVRFVDVFLLFFAQIPLFVMKFCILLPCYVI